MITRYTNPRGESFYFARLVQPHLASIPQAAIPTECETSLLRRAIDAKNRALFIRQKLDELEAFVCATREQIEKAMEGMK